MAPLHYRSHGSCWGTPDPCWASLIILPRAVAVDPAMGLYVQLELLNIFKFRSCWAALPFFIVRCDYETALAARLTFVPV